MSTIHFIGGEKGGVGKSVMARLLSQYFVDQEVAYLGLDADQSHATLSRYYGDYTQPLNLDQFESADHIMEYAVEEDRPLLIDLPSQSQRFLDRWIDENGVVDMCAELGIKVIYWYVVDDGKDSVHLLQEFLQKYGNVLTCIVVRNLGRGATFSELDAFSSASETPFPCQITLPGLHPATMRKIDVLDFSFWAAVNAKDSGVDHLSLMERQRTRVWLKNAYLAIETALSEAAR